VTTTITTSMRFDPESDRRTLEEVIRSGDDVVLHQQDQACSVTTEDGRVLRFEIPVGMSARSTLNLNHVQDGDRFDKSGWVYRSDGSRRRWFISFGMNRSGQDRRIWMTRFSDPVAPIEALHQRLTERRDRIWQGRVVPLIHEAISTGVSELYVERPYGNGRPGVRYFSTMHPLASDPYNLSRGEPTVCMGVHTIEPFGGSTLPEALEYTTRVQKFEQEIAVHGELARRLEDAYRYWYAVARRASYALELFEARVKELFRDPEGFGRYTHEVVSVRVNGRTHAWRFESHPYDNTRMVRVSASETMELT
jgi:hypothetical protein